ncbi:hypothetical protein [Halobacterium bonnevillei]|uniref:Uncharacterized protein n=1 Tax=Halobacterium bonnevillei TaxID=2692200 RepID=A0A6B0SH62_9EURY|nr:hypothetical protein [Halobacterium bonnevillei]MXR20357.1 hypothetical protein [Halobacterium bonnevillei]
MSCPYLEYKASDDGHDFDHERPYCTASGQFVSPMRADICNDRHDFHHEVDCEIYREAAGTDAPAPEPTD